MATIPSDKYIRNAKVLRVVDGDTADFLVDLGCDVKLQMRCRLNGINSPEKNTAAGEAAKAWLENQLPVNKDVIVQTVKDRKEKYGRYLAVIFSDNSKISLNDIIKTQGFAVEYHGEKRT